MTIQPGQIAAARQRVQQAGERRVQAETRLDANRTEETRLLAEALTAYGLDSLAAIDGFVAREGAAIAADLAALNAALDDAERKAAEVPDA